MLNRRTQFLGRRLRRALAASGRVFLLIGLAALPVLGFDPPVGAGLPPSSGGGGGGSNEVFGDETIGTLPIVGPTAPFDLLRFLADREASIYLEGNRLDLFGSIVYAEGRMAATLRVIDEATDTVRVTFHGRPRLVLDRSVVESGALRFGVDVPVAFGQGAVQTQVGARTFAPDAILPGAFELPATPFASASMLQRRVAFEFHGQNGAHTLLGFRTTRRFVIVDQVH